MKYTTAILSGLMATAAVAQPHARHQHNARHEKRSVVWVTDVEMVTKTVDYTTTVWVSKGASVYASSSAAVTPTTLATSPKSSAAVSTPKSSAAVSTPKSSVAASSSQSDGAVLNQKSSSSTIVTVPTSTAQASTPVAVVPTTSSTSVVIPTTSSTSIVIPTSTIVSVPVVIPTTSSVAVVVPSSTSTSTSALAATTVASSSSSESTCASGSPCSGDITFYTAGLGACGITTDGTTFAGVALPYELMGTLSNDNPYCGKTITITCTTTGKTTTATVIDKCMGCVGDAIDLTNFAFDQLAEEAVGRTTATWFFND